MLQIYCWPFVIPWHFTIAISICSSCPFEEGTENKQWLISLNLFLPIAHNGQKGQENLD